MKPAPAAAAEIIALLTTRPVDNWSNVRMTRGRFPGELGSRRLSLTVHAGRVLVAALFVFPEQSQSTVPTPKLRVEKYTLTNGLQVMLNPDQHTPIVSVSVRYRVPTTPNPPDLTGLGHVMEHILLSAPLRHIPDAERDTVVLASGGTGDAATALDASYQWSYAPSRYLAQLLWLRSDQMAFARPTEDDIAREREVVLSERRLRVDNARYGPADHALWAALFPPPHPYRQIVMGSAADVKKVTLRDVLDVYKQYYHASNASVVIDGDFIPTDARQLVDQYFGTLPSGPSMPPPASLPLRPASRQEIVLRLHASAPRITIAWVTPPAFELGDAEIELLSHALGDGKNGILYRRLVRELRMASETSCLYNGGRLGSRLKCDVVLGAGTHVEQVRKALAEIVEGLRRDGPGLEDLQRAQILWAERKYRELEIGWSRANLINQYNHMAGDANYLQTDFERHQTVTIQSVRSVAQKYLADEHTVFFLAEPEGK